MSFRSFGITGHGTMVMRLAWLKGSWQQKLTIVIFIGLTLCAATHEEELICCPGRFCKEEEELEGILLH